MEGRRLRGDLIQAFKLLKGLDQINYNNFFVLDVNTSRRGHTLKVAKPSARLDIRLHNFSHRVVNCWNNLPVEIFECQSINNFKYKLECSGLTCSVECNSTTHKQAIDGYYNKIVMALK